MKSIVGLVEYTVTGAFVWVVFFLFLAWVSVDAPGYADSVTEIWAAWAGKLPALQDGSEVSKMISAAVAGAFFVAVFVTGAMLDLLAPALFVVLEIRWAKKWIFARWHEWLARLVEERGAFLAADYNELARKHGTTEKPVEWQAGKYRRFTTFLISYVLATAKPAQVEDVLERLKLWRVNQAMCLAVFVLTLAVPLWMLNTWEVRHAPLRALVAGIVLPLMLNVVWYVSMRLSFYRLVVALEPALYLAFMQEHRAAPAQPAAPVALAGVRSFLGGAAGA